MRVASKTRRQQIMVAAARLFSRLGFEGTTTREIARSAGVNEAIIFRHFTSKDELYWAVVSERIRERAFPDRLRRHLASSRTPKQALYGVAETLLRGSHKDADLTRLLLFSALRNRQLSQDLFDNYLTESLSLVSDYIREGVERGWLREMDPVVGARSFVGMVVYQRLMHELFGDGPHPNYDPRQLGQQLADIWLNGACARQSASAPRSPSNGSSRDVPGVGRKPASKPAGGALQRARNAIVTA